MIVGHGAAGRTLASDVVARGGSVVGFLDDASVSEEVVGKMADVNDVVDRFEVDLIYFAIPSATAQLVREFITSVGSPGVHFAMVPRTYATITKESVSIGDLTDIDILDLVGREPVKHDLVASKEFLRGKRVLITGAAGSIGSRLVRQIVGMEPALVVCVDWWENGIFHLGQELGTRDDVVHRIADVKNLPLLRSIFSEYRPEIVFHAAAYKHVPLMQDNPLEAINNNVHGSLNVFRQAAEHGANCVVYVSTDKAVNPVNVMGSTKRLGEMIMESICKEYPETKFNAVRFGNVIESNGSVMQTFRSQIATKRPLTVTHPDITRFFMTIDEATQLIIQSALLGHDKEIFVLDMGEPVKILDLAKSLVRALDPSLQIEITGLRPGEKMYEELSYEPDRVERTTNQKIFVVRDEPTFDPEVFMSRIEDLLDDASRYAMSSAEAVERLRGFGFKIQ